MSCTCRKVQDNQDNDGYNDRVETAEEIRLKFEQRLQYAMKFHLFLGLMFAYKNVPEMIDEKPATAVIFEGYLTIPNAHLWRTFWVVGVASMFKAIEALHYKNSYALKKFRLYIQTCGVMSIVLGHQMKLAELEYEYKKLDGDRENLMWHGVPIKFIWFTFFFLAFITHGLELYMSRGLVNAWKIKTDFEMKPMTKKKK